MKQIVTKINLHYRKAVLTSHPEKPLNNEKIKWKLLTF